MDPKGSYIGRNEFIYVSTLFLMLYYGLSFATAQVAEELELSVPFLLADGFRLISTCWTEAK